MSINNLELGTQNLPQSSAGATRWMTRSELRTRNSKLNSPFFSVIIPTFNRAKFIKKAIDSILNQTFQNFEIIIIDDASTDDTEEIVKSIKDERIIYVKNKENLERCITRNVGISIANGQYICFLDSDDYHLKNHLETFYTEIEKRNFPVAVFFTNAYDENINHERKERIVPYFHDYNPYEYILKYTFNAPRSCGHRDIFNEFLFDPNILVCEDLDLFCRIATKYPIYHIPEYTTVYYLHEDTFTLGDPLKPFKEYDSYKKIFSKPILKKKLPRKGKNRLFSMCHFNFAVHYEKERKWLKMYKSIIKSFFLCPEGYNRKTNKILLAMFVNHLPVIGWIKRRVT